MLLKLVHQANLHVPVHLHTAGSYWARLGSTRFGL
jgi:hypothetical protein